MPTTVREYRPDDRAALLSVLQAPGVAEQFDMYAGDDGVERLLGDPYTPAEGVRMAFVDGEPAGFACAILLKAAEPWTMLRIGVLPRFRRGGIGRALHDELSVFVRTQTRVPDMKWQLLAAWEPLEPATGMAEKLGYAHDRWFWLMGRPRGGATPVPEWPAGITVRALDGSDAMLADWNKAYNESFAGHYRFVPSPMSNVRALVQKAGFRADGIVIAYRDGEVAGFCRNELFAARGEIGTVGTLPAARGIGLGRALLRWGVAWLERETPHPITLLVDGDNEGALGLYRSEGFEITRRRHLWSQPVVRA
ncbi:MAG TPA: GNAT family N-acetyltransferase [Methylomirabilota bacterium]|jgi:mycothiol synthase|nr:GNAT family N-acetyltransferase [Methylomirabilota bacterium]